MPDTVQGASKATPKQARVGGGGARSQVLLPKCVWWRRGWTYPTPPTPRLRPDGLCPSAGQREAPARLESAEPEGGWVGEAGDQEGGSIDRQERGPWDRDTGWSQRPPRDGVSGRPGAGTGRRGRGGDGGGDRAEGPEGRPGWPRPQPRSQLQRRPRAGGARGECSRAGACPLSACGPSARVLRGEQASRHPAGTPRDPSPPQLPSVPAFPSAGPRGRADSPGDPCLAQGVLESIRGAERETTCTGPGSEAPLGLSHLPLEMGVLLRTTFSSGVWARCLDLSSRQAAAAAAREGEVGTNHPCLPLTGEETKTQRGHAICLPWVTQPKD